VVVLLAVKTIAARVAIVFRVVSTVLVAVVVVVVSIQVLL